MIHKSSVIDSKAKISNNVKIGPFCYVGPNVILDDNVELISNELQQTQSSGISDNKTLLILSKRLDSFLV